MNKFLAAKRCISVLINKVYIKAILALLVFFISISNVTFADSAKQKTYQVAKQGQVSFEIPAGWTDVLHSPGPELPPTIEFRIETPNRIKILVTPFWNKNSPGVPPTLEEIRSFAEYGRVKVASTAIEKDIQLKPFLDKGYYYEATDRAPKPGEFAHVTQGVIVVGNLFASFTILSDGKPEVVSESLNFMKSMKRI